VSFIAVQVRILLAWMPRAPAPRASSAPAILFAPQVLAAGAAPLLRAPGAAGALLMAADRHAAHELMLSVPPLLELLPASAPRRSVRCW